MLPAFLVLLGNFKCLRELFIKGLFSQCKKWWRNKRKYSYHNGDGGYTSCHHVIGVHIVDAEPDTEPNIRDTAFNSSESYALLFDKEEGMGENTETFWIKLGKICYRRRLYIVIGTLALLIPAVLVALRITPTTDQSLLLSSTSQSVRATRMLEAAGFSTGVLAPYYIAAIAQPCSSSDLQSGTCTILPCNNDNEDLMQMARMHGFNIDSCDAATVYYPSACNETVTGAKIEEVMSVFCPGACSTYCPANRTSSVMDSDFFDVVSLTRGCQPAL